MTVRRLTGLWVIVLAALLIAGCGSGDDETFTSPVASTPAESTTGNEETSAEDPGEQPRADSPEIAEAKAKLESKGYSVTEFTNVDDLENLADGKWVVAQAGIKISGHGVHQAVGYVFAAPREARAVWKSIPGLASSINGTRLYFVGERAPNAAVDRMVAVAEG